jgi:hypothetical protein
VHPRAAALLQVPAAGRLLAMVPEARNGGMNLIFDADDTLWDSNIHFLEAEATFLELLSLTQVARPPMRSATWSGANANSTRAATSPVSVYQGSTA